VTLGSVKIDKRELIMFSRQLALLIESGIGVIRGLEIIQLQTSNAAFKKIIGEVIADLQDGKTLAAAMARHPKMFSTMYHRTISAGSRPATWTKSCARWQTLSNGRRSPKRKSRVRLLTR